MSSENHIRDLIDRWPTRRAMSDEVGAKEAAVHKWARSGRIPSQHQAAVVAAAQKRGFAEITAEWMLLAHMRRDETAKRALASFPRADGEEAEAA